MTSSNPPPELTVSDDDAAFQQEHNVHMQARKLNLDDAFSLNDENNTVPFDFDADSFLNQLRSSATIGANEDEEGSWNDKKDAGREASEGGDGGPPFGSTNASVSTLDIYGTPDKSHNQAETSPRTAASPNSTQSDALPPTPPEEYPHTIPSPHYGADSPNGVSHIIKTPTDTHNHSRTHMDAVRTEVALPSPIQHAASNSTSTIISETSQGTAESPNGNGVRHSLESRHSQPDTSDTNSAPTHARNSHSQSIPGKSRPNGPSVFQKVVSKTRPPYLPPKEKAEDIKHNKEWEQMMHQSRAAEQKRRDDLQARRLARELAIEANTPLWERSVLPDFKKAVRDPQLQKLWWEGVPTKLRSIVWERAVGNGLALSKDTYSSSLARAKSLLANGRFPKTALGLMEADIETTLPQLHIFNSLTGPLYDDLRNLLCAWIVSRAEEGLGYVEGAAKIGGMLLLNLNGPAQAYVVMRNLLERSCLRAFYGGPSSREDVEAYYRIFDTLLADGMPKVYFNFKQHQISPADYLPDWILSLFLNHLPLEACSRIWDVLLLEGDAFLYRAALAVLSSIESRLFFPDRKELLEVLKGESRPALEVFRREAPRAFIGPQGDIIGPKYEIYGVNEETVWERITEMSEWWKESTWQRLIVRELPDL